MKRLALLDFVKIFSIIIIVFHHFQQITGYTKGINFANGEIYFGYLCELFFMISGYLCVHLESRPMMKDITPIRKFVLRWERLFPSVAVVNLSALVISWIYLLYNGHWWKGFQHAAFEGIRSILLLSHGPILGDDGGLINVTWVIEYLLVCYFIFYLGQKTKNDKLFYAVFLFVNIMVYSSGIYIPIFFTTSALRGFIPFFIGVFLYYLSNKINYKTVFTFSVSILIYIIFNAAIWIFGNSIGYETHVLNDYYWLLLYVIFPIIVLNLGHSQMYFPRLEKIGGYVGELSFYIYILHYPGMMLGRLIVDFVCGRDYKPDINLISMIIYTLIVIVFAAIFKRFVGDPLKIKVKDIESNLLNKKKFYNT